jgi:rhomboid protease GluP
MKQEVAVRRATLFLAMILLGVFVVESARGAAGSELALVPLGALRTRGWSAADCWRVLTFSFLHLNWLHLVTNTAALVWLGGIVESRLGSIAFLAIFACAAIASGIAGMLLGPLLPTTGVAIGASGAIFGLLATALMLAFGSKPSPYPETDRRLRTPLLICAVAVAATSFLPGVSLAGHLGGFGGGALVAWMVM